jgi:galactokinase
VSPDLVRSRLVSPASIQRRQNASVVARAPGRVNLIGDHTDYTGGLVLPMAIDRWTIVVGDRGGNHVQLRSAQEPTLATVPLRVAHPQRVEPAWARFVAGIVAEMAPAHGFAGTVDTDVPVGAGLSSSAALEVATALALGFEGTALQLAQLCQRAEVRASGVPTGIMDQLCSAAGVEGHALLIDCHSLDITPVALPSAADAEIVVVYGHHRTLVGSEYATRVAECAAAEAIIGPLRLAATTDLAQIKDKVVRARARHVINENRRVTEFAAAMRAGDLNTAGALMVESHVSLRDDYATSTDLMDGVVARLCALDGVHGARMTGGGFGGCVVALARPGSVGEGWIVRAVAGASVVVSERRPPPSPQAAAETSS